MPENPALIAFGAKLRAARVAANLSQNELSERTGMARRPIHLAETGRGSIRIDNLVRILDELNLELDLKPSDNPKPFAPPRKPLNENPEAESGESAD